MIKKVQIVDRKQELELGDKKYSINPTNYKFIKKCENYTKEIEALSKDADNIATIDEFVEVAKKLINFVCDDDWDYIWEEVCGEDIQNVISVIEAVSEIIQAGKEIKYSQYIKK